MKKKKLIIVIAACVAAVLVGVGAFALITNLNAPPKPLDKVELEEAEKKYGLDFELSEDGKYYVVVGNHESVEKESLKKVVIPEKLGNMPVKSIDLRKPATNEDGEIIKEDGKIVYSDDEFKDDWKNVKEISVPDTIESVYFDFGECLFLEYNGYDGVQYLGNDKNKCVILVKAASEKIETCKINEKTKVVCKEAFLDCAKLKEIVVPESVEQIGERAFKGCDALESLTVPFLGRDKNAEGTLSYLFGKSEDWLDSTVYQGSRAYIPVSLRAVVIGDKGTIIGKNAFDCCSGLTSVTIGKSVKSIGNWAFSVCKGLTSVTIPDSVTEIGSYAFNNCTGLTSVTIGNGVTSIGGWAFYGCTGLTSVNIGKNVTSIGDSAFSRCTGIKDIYYTGDIASWCGISGLGNVTSSSRTLYIDGKKIEGELVIPESVTSIGEYAFRGCTGLTSVTIPDSVTSIGTFAFYDCEGLTSVTIPDSVTSIGGCALYGCEGLTSVTIPDSVTSIGYQAFYGCEGLTSIIIPESVTEIGSAAFAYCRGLTSIIIPESVTEIGYQAFYGCKGLTSIIIPDSVTSIGKEAFNDCKGLTSIIIPDSVTSIGKEAFNGCKGLTSVTIGKNVNGIGDSAFSGCEKLIEVINNSSLNITKGSEDNGYIAYYALSVKKGGSTDIANKDGYLFMTADNTNYLLGYVGNDTELTLPENYNDENYGIYQYAFYGCSGLTSITIPDSVTSIGDSAFLGCSGLTSVTIPDSVTSIGKEAFNGCYKLVEVINNSNLNITKGSNNNGKVAYNALSVKKGGTTDIVNKDGYLFYTYDSVNYLFGYTGTDTDLTLPENYNGQNYEIYKYAFYNYTTLTSVTIGKNVTSIGDSAFSGCKGLKTIYYRGSEEQWNAITKSSYWNYNTGNYTVVYNAE